MNPTSAGMGPSARAVLARHDAAVAQYRRWTVAARVVTGALVVSAVLPFAALVVATNGFDTPMILNFIPVGLLIPWLLWNDEILTLLGRPGHPHFPGEMLRIAQDNDRRAANPQPFGSLPPDPRLRPRSW